MTTGNNYSAGPQPAGPQKIVCLAVTESDDPSHDAHLLREVIGVLLEYPGRDRVNLEIRTAEKRIRMDLPVVSTGYCEAMHARLEELLGPDTVVVHQELGLGVEPPVEAPVNMPLEAGPPAASGPAPAGVAEATGTPVSTAVDLSAPADVESEGDEPPF